jgi:mersacidin/lichenicidin family type 2 lantibiotic
MSKQNIIRAWKDETYRRSLSEAERAALPENPVGRVDLDELTAAEMAEIDGGLFDNDIGYNNNTDQCSTYFSSCRYLP